jgi:predicted permease
MPDVVAVGLADNPQLGLGNSDWGVTIPGYTPAPNEGMSINVYIVGPGYLEAMGIPLLSGRGFAARDDSSAARAVVVNRRFVERFWPDQDPIGRVVRTGGRDHIVIGVTPTGKYRSLGEDPLAIMYLAQAQHFEAGAYIHIRTRGDPTAIAPVLRAEVSALDPNLPVSDVRTMTSHLGIALLPARLAGAALAIFGLIGLTLASLGIYGVMAGTVARRKREIGIRIAIGAAGGSVVKLMLRDGLRLVALGTVIGLVGALGAARLIGGLLYGGSGLDPVTFSAVPAILALVAMVAIWIPARRASAIDPVEALRQE